MRTKRPRIRTVALLLFLSAVLFGGQALVSHRDQISFAWRSTLGLWGNGDARFVDRAAEAGLRYRWSIPGARPIDILQGIGNGCAFLDYDNDGNLDILLIGPRLALYRGDGRGHFTDETQAAGLGTFSGHFLGCAVGDYDNDGFDDVYISGYRTGLLLHNERGRGYKDVTQAAGMITHPWETSCAWGDVDGDGRLDLYVCAYVDFDPPRTPRLCEGVNGEFHACEPQMYRPERGVLYHNEGPGHFRDVTRAWGADATAGNSLGVAFADYDNSRRQGFFVANDTQPQTLFKNFGRHVTDIGGRSGAAYADATSQAGMGVDWGDYDNDGHPDLFLGTFALAPKVVFHNAGPDLFTEESDSLGLRGRPIGVLTFGSKWLDYDNDGWLDLMFANGHVLDNIADFQPQTSYREPTLLFHNKGGRRLADVSDEAGPSLPKSILGRGLAVGDYDNDGRLDALVVDSEGAPLLLHNESRKSGHWLRLTLVGARSNRDGYGATVTVTAGGRTQTRWCHTDGSYLSASDKRVHVGLGDATTASSVRVRWPSGRVSALHDVPADRQIAVRE